MANDDERGEKASVSDLFFIQNTLNVWP